jgi:hypothetical protein
MGEEPAVLENIGFEVVSYHDLGGMPGFKMAVYQEQERWLLYTAHLWHRGWSILDVTDASNPERVNVLTGPENTWTIQVQAADGRLVTALEKPVAGWGVEAGLPFDEGAHVWDLSSDATKPRLTGTWRTGETGTHRNFYAGGRYAYMAATRPGYFGHVLVILDIAEPDGPREVGFWALPIQDKSNPDAVDQAYLHGPAYVQGDRAYLSYGRMGLVILDVSDRTRPEFISRLSFGGLGSFLGCHSAVPIPGRDLLVANSEAIDDGTDGELNYAFVVDISDETRPRVIGSLPQPVPSPGLPYASYYRKGGRFGPHNQHHYQGNPAHAVLRNHVLLTYFNAGLRLYDISDPWEPVEVGCFVPADPRHRRGALPAELVTQFEDVIVDARGFIYCTDKNHGLFVLRYRDGLS